VVEVPEFSPEMTERTEFLEGDEFPIESLVIARSSDHPPLTLLTTLQSVIVPDILSKKNKLN
jgi:hypothetical protein